MVDVPPADLSAQPTKDWKQFVGEQPSGNQATTPPPIAGGVSFSNEDAPPSGNRLDLVQQQTVADMAANRKLRDKYADRAYQLASGCITAWVVMLGTQGVVKAVTGVEMWSDKVIIAATTGVTVSVLAAFLGVIRGLFPNGNGSGSKGK